MSVLAPVRVRQPEQQPIRGRPDRPGRRPTLPILMAVQGAAFVLLVGLAGSPIWRTLRILTVLAIIAAAMLEVRRAGRSGRGGTALALGVAGTVAGAGIGGVYLAKVGMSLMTVAGLISLVTGVWLLLWGAALLVRALPGWWRVLAVPAGLLILAFVLYPLTMAVNVTNRPATPLGSANPSDRGLTYVDASFRTSDGVRLSAWYVPSRNGGAVVLLPGSGSTRSAVLGHAVVLSRHGYGVLLVDTRGHGRSEGHAMDVGWYGNLDIAAAVSYLAGRPDVRGGRIAAVGMSMGGEQAIAAAGADPRIRAVVSEGTTGMQPADHGWLSHYGFRGFITKGIDWVTYEGADLLSSAHRPMSLRDAVRAAAPRPVLLIAAGETADEALAGRFFREGSPGTVKLWVVPGAGHTGGLATHPAEWEARVTAFLDRALRSS